MANSKSFISVLRDGTDFTVTLNAGQSFNLVRSYQKTFSLTIGEFHASATLWLNVSQTFTITSFLRQTLRVFTALEFNAPLVYVQDTMLKLSQRIFQPISISAPLIDFVFRLRSKMPDVAMTMGTPVLNMLLRLRERISNVTFIASSLDIVASAIMRQYHHLYEYDSDALYSMDSETLQDLDYTAV